MDLFWAMMVAPLGALAIAGALFLTVAREDDRHRHDHPAE